MVDQVSKSECALWNNLGTAAMNLQIQNGQGTMSGTLQASAITSADSVTFTYGTGGTFVVAATGFPRPILSAAGALPSGASFNPLTGVLTVPPTVPAGTYSLNFTAKNPVGAAATQSFVLTVNPAPLTISANSATKILNAALPSLTGTYGGFVNGDGPSSLSGTLNCTTAATATSPVGNYVITCSGPTSTNYSIAFKSGTLSIIYEPGGACDGDVGHAILQPINADGTSVWKQGRTIPAKFRVCDANGVSIGTPGVVASFNLTAVIAGTVTNVNETVSSTTPDSAFRWDPTGQQWIFNISTANLAASQTYIYTITLNDGSTIVFQYGLQ